MHQKSTQKSVLCFAGLVLWFAGVCFLPTYAWAQLLTGYGASAEDRVDDSIDEGHSSEIGEQADVEIYALPGLDVPEPEAPTQPSNTDTAEEDNQGPVDLSADSLFHDEDKQIITASGNVMMVQDGRILRADEVEYNLAKDTAIARGHVVLNEVNGDIHYAQEVEFNDKLKNGFVKGLKSYLNDGSRFMAEEGTRTGGTRTEMEHAIYTPCDPCKNNPEAAPVWQIKASEVVHDEEDHRISYKNARFEVFGVPVAYTPYFSHPDGTIKRKSGFLAPVLGYKSNLGMFAGGRYYWDIMPSMDATFGAIAMTDESPIGFMELRKRWENAELTLSGAVTESDHIEEVNGVETLQKDDLRGHFMADGLWDINDKWRAVLNTEWVSDDQYMNQYNLREFDLSGENVLESEVYLERFSGRNYAVGRFLTFQDIRVDDKEDQPEVLPEIIASFKGEPGAIPVLKGQWGIDTSFLGLQREGGDQDMNRFSVEGSWNRRLVSDYGLLTKVQASVRGDAYSTRDRLVAVSTPGQQSSTEATRLYSNLYMENSYPLVRDFENAQLMIEPVVSLSLGTDVDVNNNIPNEDSQDVQIDASNLFEINRFSGLDRIEDRSKVTYGLRAGLYDYDGGHIEVFGGQSYRFSEGDNPFPDGSGLNEQRSDVVGQVLAMYGSKYSLNYRFQLDSDTLSGQRHEVDASADWETFSLGGSYLFAQALEGTDISEDREQLKSYARYKIGEDWRLRTGGTYDFGKEESGLRKAYFGVDYFGQCVSLSVVGQRNYTDDASGESDTEIIFRIGLKNLGEFSAIGLQLGGTSD